VKCGNILEEGSSAVLKGCVCGGKLFFYIKKELLGSKETPFILTSAEKEQIVNDVYDIIGDEIDREKPIILDMESISILKPGKYELDLVHLFQKNRPLVYKLEDGKYIIDLIETFKRIHHHKIPKKGK